jgi:hypothetical protein
MQPRPARPAAADRRPSGSKAGRQAVSDHPRVGGAPAPCWPCFPPCPAPPQRRMAARTARRAACPPRQRTPTQRPQRKRAPPARRSAAQRAQRTVCLDGGGGTWWSSPGGCARVGGPHRRPRGPRPNANPKTLTRCLTSRRPYESASRIFSAPPSSSGCSVVRPVSACCTSATESRHAPAGGSGGSVVSRLRTAGAGAGAGVGAGAGSGSGSGSGARGRVRVRGRH